MDSIYQTALNLLSFDFFLQNLIFFTKIYAKKILTKMKYWPSVQIFIQVEVSKMSPEAKWLEALMYEYDFLPSGDILLTFR